MIKRMTVFVVALSAAPAIAADQPWACQSTAAYCDPNATPAQLSLCLGYVAGFQTAAGAIVPKPICTPAGAEPAQLVAVVSKWVKDHPERWHEPFGNCVLSALASAFPCESAK